MLPDNNRVDRSKTFFIFFLSCLSYLSYLGGTIRPRIVSYLGFCFSKLLGRRQKQSRSDNRRQDYISGLITRTCQIRYNYLAITMQLKFLSKFERASCTENDKNDLFCINFLSVGVKYICLHPYGLKITNNTLLQY